MCDWIPIVGFRKFSRVEKVVFHICFMFGFDFYFAGLFTFAELLGEAKLSSFFSRVGHLK